MPAHPKPSARKALKLAPTSEVPAADQKARDEAAHAADAAQPAPAHKPKKASAPKKDHIKVGDKLTGAIEGTVASVLKGETKGAQIQAMLKSPGGATSKEMEAATGWQPHSVRGFLGTLRKAGVKVISKKLPKEPTIYRIEAEKASAAEAEVL